jgi:cytochrome b561/polyisoprenoid-binding protein YceI
MTRSRYSNWAILLHWLLAGLLAFQIGTGWLMEDMEKGTGLFNLAQFHKSVGISILLLSLLRVAIRIVTPLPAPLADDGLSEKLAQAVHFGLYLFMIAVPISGWVLVSTSGRNIDTILFNTIPWPHIPGLSGASEPVKAGIHEVAEWLHGSLTWLGIALFLLHVAGALRHQFAKSEPMLSRILPVWGAERKFPGTVMIAALGIAAGGFLITGQNFHLAPSAAGTSVSSSKPAGTKSRDSVDAPTLAAAAWGKRTPPPEKTDAAAADVKETAAAGENNLEAADTGSGIPKGAAPNWTIATNRSLRFVAKWGSEDIRGSFSRWNGTVRFNPDALDNSSVRIVVDLTSASTADSEWDQTLQGSDFFATSSATSATYSATSFRKISESRYQANGTLTLKGMSRPQALTFTLTINDKKAVVTGNAALSRMAYNVGVGDYGEIADMVQLQFNFSATR